VRCGYCLKMLIVKALLTSTEVLKRIFFDASDFGEGYVLLPLWLA
jgi:hypothetical protein